MKWSNTRMIFIRELRDQLRDRRTLLTIAVLPLILYPLLGMCFLQVSQFMQESPSRLWIVGAENLPTSPPLLVEGQWADPLVGDDLVEIELEAQPWPLEQDLKAAADQRIREGEVDAVLWIPAGFAEQLSGQGSLGQSRDTPQEATPPPTQQIFVNSASDRSRVAYTRLESILENWRRQVVQENLRRQHVAPAAIEPFLVADVDLAEQSGRQAVVWAKILPFVVLVWALTGAFYPAIDLCAGEKERGTLETLLSSPALRSEIVWGKLLTVMVFSIATSTLNMVSMGITGTLIARQMQAMPGAGAMVIGAPPLHAMLWLFVGLLPIAAMFSALSLAVAAFARSTKEGQYYLMPLMFISMPLMILPILPSAELNLGTSLIPVTGVLLLLRKLIEGQILDALPFLPPVALVTGVCCWLSIRWAVDQFNNESVLFRESERFGLGTWLRHTLRERGNTPTIAQAVTCALLLLLIRFFAGFSTTVPTTWLGFAKLQSITLIAMIAAPAVLMALLVTRSPQQTLLLKLPRLGTLPLAVLLAVAIHPTMMAIAQVIESLYPLNDDLLGQMSQLTSLFAAAPSFWQILLVMALLPAICEELAFRGFILSGLRHLGHKWGAIVFSSIFFGVAHGILQQSISATLVGLVMGYLAVQTRSLLPCVLFHLTYNSMSLSMGLKGLEWVERWPVLKSVWQVSAEGVSYPTALTIVSLLATAATLSWFARIPFEPSDEEKLQDILDHQPAQSVSS